MSAPLIGTTRTDGEEEEEEEGFDEAVPGAGPPVTATAAAAAVAPGAPVHHVRLMGLASFWFGASALQSALLVLVLADRMSLMAPEATRSTAVGVCASLSGLLTGIVQPVAGSYSDRFGSRWGRRTPFLVVGSLGSALFLLPLGVGGVMLWLWLFVAAFVLTNAALGLAMGPFYAIIPDVVPPGQYGVASGYMGLMDMLGTTFGAAVMGLVAGALVRQFGSFFVPVLIILAGALLLAVGTTLLALREGAAAPVPDASPLRGLALGARITSAWRSFCAPFASRDFFWVFLTRFLMMSGIAAVRGFLLYWMEDVVGPPFVVFGVWDLCEPLTATTNGTVVAAACDVSQAAKMATSLFLLPLLVGATAAALVAGALSDRFGRKVMVYLAGAIQAATAVGMIVWPTMSAVVFLGFFFGLGYGAYQSVDFALAADVLPDAETRAKDLGVWNISATLASIAAPLLAGMLLDAFKAIGQAHLGSKRLGYTVLFSCGTAVFVLSTVLVTRIRGGGRVPLSEPVELVEIAERDEAKRE